MHAIYGNYKIHDQILFKYTQNKTHISNIKSHFEYPKLNNLQPRPSLIHKIESVPIICTCTSYVCYYTTCSRSMYKSANYIPRISLANLL